MVAPGPSPRAPVKLDADVLQIILDVFRKYGHMSNSEIKTAAYQTRPMRFILAKERGGADMRNKSVLYKNMAIVDKESPSETP